MSEEPNLNDATVLANLPGKDIYGVPVGDMVNAIESAAAELARLRGVVEAAKECRDEGVFQHPWDCAIAHPSLSRPCDCGVDAMFKALAALSPSDGAGECSPDGPCGVDGKCFDHTDGPAADQQKKPR